MKLEDFHDIETRQTDHATGGQKGSKDTMIGALDPVALLLLGRIAGMGAKKYEAFNFLKGYDWSLSYNALLRHLFLWLAGEDLDVESGLPHMAHAMWHAHALVGFQARGIGTDDRAPKLDAPPKTEIIQEMFDRIAPSKLSQHEDPLEVGRDPWHGTRCAYLYQDGMRCGAERAYHDVKSGPSYAHEYLIQGL